MPNDIADVPKEPLSATVLETRTGRVPGPGILAALGWTLLLLVVQTGVVIVAVVPLMLLRVSPDRMTSVLFPLGGATVVLLAVALTVALFGSRTRAVLGLRRLGLGHALLVSLTVAPLAVVAAEIGTWAAKVLPSFSQDAYKGLAQEPYWFVLIFGCILPAVGEEVYFRGFVGRGLVARHGMIAGGLLSAVMFGLVHVDPVQATGLLVIGLTLQGVFVATKSLLAPMLLHGLNNALGFAVLKYDDGGSEPVDHFPLLFAAAAALALVALGVLFYQMRTRWLCPDGSEWSPGYVTAEAPPANILAQCRAGRPSARCLIAAALAYAAFVGAIGWILATSSPSV
jgi:hypothetical protein